MIRWDLDLAGLEGACADGGPPTVAIECFACGRPPAFEELLFDPNRDEPRLIVNLEHLTAETWAEELHRMPSGTRSALVHKAIFMPGFAPSTGGLLIDSSYRETATRWKAARGPTAGSERAELRRDLALRAGLPVALDVARRPWYLVFSYVRDYRSIVAGIASDVARNAGNGRVEAPLVIVAAGPSAPCFLSAWRSAGKPFPVLELPFLPQETWDEFVLAADFALIRGEESLARAALGGVPFLWHAYRQDDNYQLVKVRALLERLRPHFATDDFATYEALSLAFNDRLSDGPAATGGENIRPFLEALPDIGPGFERFSSELVANGDLAAGLLSFIREFLIRR